MSKKPFEESILDSLYAVQNLEQLKILAKLIVETEISEEFRETIATGFLLAQQCIRYAGGEVMVDIVVDSLMRPENRN